MCILASCQLRLRPVAPPPQSLEQATIAWFQHLQPPPALESHTFLDDPPSLAPRSLPGTSFHALQASLGILLRAALWLCFEATHLDRMPVTVEIFNVHSPSILWNSVQVANRHRSTRKHGESTKKHGESTKNTARAQKSTARAQKSTAR